jgi:hypothetical protein
LSKEAERVYGNPDLFFDGQHRPGPYPDRSGTGRSGCFHAGAVTLTEPHRGFDFEVADLFSPPDLRP